VVRAELVLLAASRGNCAWIWRSLARKGRVLRSSGQAKGNWTERVFLFPAWRTGLTSAVPTGLVLYRRDWIFEFDLFWVMFAPVTRGASR